MLFKTGLIKLSRWFLKFSKVVQLQILKSSLFHSQMNDEKKKISEETMFSINNYQTLYFSDEVESGIIRY